MSSHEPLLTICIPTYNRGARVYSLVVFLLEQVVSKYRESVELLVVDNCSTDDTMLLLAPLFSQGVRLINRERHLPSAEANMFASVELCNGRYIWFHGDDDIPLAASIDGLLTGLIENDVDLYVTNSISIDIDGVILADRLLKMNAPYIDVAGAGQLVFACGFLHVLAGISGVVFRRSMVDMNAAREVSGLQEIYSHVAWLIHCFSHARIRIIARPLVYYRTDVPSQQLQHFKVYAKNKGIGDHYVWSFGLVKLLNYLLDCGDLTAADVARCYDGRRDGTRFHMLDEIIAQIYNQIKSGLKDLDSRNRVSKAEFEDAKRFLYKIDLFSFDTVSILGEILEVQDRYRGRNLYLWRYKVRALSRKFERVFRRQLADGFYRHLTVGSLRNYTIYRTPVGYAALSDEINGDRASVLSYLDPMEKYPEVLTGIEIKVVHDKIEQVVRRQLDLEKAFADPTLGVGNLGSALKSIGDGIHAYTASHVQEVEIARQRSYVVRLLGYRLVFVPLRRVLSSLQNRVRQYKQDQ